MVLLWNFPLWLSNRFRKDYFSFEKYSDSSLIPLWFCCRECEKLWSPTSPFSQKEKKIRLLGDFALKLDAWSETLPLL